MERVRQQLPGSHPKSTSLKAALLHCVQVASLRSGRFVAAQGEIECRTGSSPAKRTFSLLPQTNEEEP